MKIKKRVTKGFKHRKLPGYPKGCHGFLVPLQRNPDAYLYCTACGWTVSMELAEYHGYKQDG